MSGFLQIQKFEFGAETLKEAYAFLREVGTKSYEAVALFAGEVEGNVGIIKKVICPEQTSSRSELGLLYSVEGEELHRINIQLYKNKLVLLAQIHTHPGRAYHSETDDEFPIISTLGGLSIVVPNFASDELNHLNWAYYRLSVTAMWDELSQNEIRNLIKVV
ncbi:hypothetical protein [Aurantibacillus circumpalustris]|uniref:hypothetical protein n=1 Tax=Aurantibacillus circumpalustris TaxID=3036359 RepID=UPI00295B0DAC|nr:hypothetical protein [Aurantibacillus circumpalustris]